MSLEPQPQQLPLFGERRLDALRAALFRLRRRVGQTATAPRRLLTRVLWLAAFVFLVLMVSLLWQDVAYTARELELMLRGSAGSSLITYAYPITLGIIYLIISRRAEGKGGWGLSLMRLLLAVNVLFLAVLVARGIGRGISDVGEEGSRRLTYSSGATAAVLILYTLFWRLPKRQLSAYKDRLELKDYLTLVNSTRATLAQIVGGALVLSGLYYTAQNLAVSQENARLTLEREQSERMDRAINMLKDENPEVRLAAIYNLQRLGAISVENFGLVREILSGFVRSRLAWKGPMMDPKREREGPPGDIQAAVNGLVTDPPESIIRELTRRRFYPQNEDGRRDDRRDTGIPIVDLRGTDLRGFNLSNAHLSGAILTSAHLEGAYLQDAELWNADFSGAVLTGADLSGAYLTSAKFISADLSDADLRGVRAYGVDFGSARLDRAVLGDSTFFDSINLTPGQVQNARIEGKVTWPKDWK